MTQQNSLSKVQISSADCEETLWAIATGENQYQLQNLPFYSYGYAYDDVVQTKPQEGSFPVVVAVVRRSKHSTFRIFLNADVENIEELASWAALQRLGCTYERATKRLFAIDSPATVNVAEVENLLQAGEQQKLWEYEVGFVFRQP